MASSCCAFTNYENGWDRSDATTVMQFLFASASLVAAVFVALPRFFSMQWRYAAELPNEFAERPHPVGSRIFSAAFALDLVATLLFVGARLHEKDTGTSGETPSSTYLDLYVAFGAVTGLRAATACVALHWTQISGSKAGLSLFSVLRVVGFVFALAAAVVAVVLAAQQSANGDHVGVKGSIIASVVASVFVGAAAAVPALQAEQRPDFWRDPDSGRFLVLLGMASSAAGGILFLATTDTCSKPCANTQHGCIFPDAVNHWFVKYLLDFVGTILVTTGLLCAEHDDTFAPPPKKPAGDSVEVTVYTNADGDGASISDKKAEKEAAKVAAQMAELQKKESGKQAKKEKAKVKDPTPATTATTVDNAAYTPGMPTGTTTLTNTTSTSTITAGADDPGAPGSTPSSSAATPKAKPASTRKGSGSGSRGKASKASAKNAIIDDKLLRKMYDLFSSADTEADAGLSKKEFKENLVVDQLKAILGPLGKLSLFSAKKLKGIPIKADCKADELGTDELFFWLDRSTVRGSAEEATVTILELLVLIQRTADNVDMWAAKRKLYQMFQAADTDGDHALTEQEFAVGIDMKELKKVLMQLEALHMNTVLGADFTVAPAKLFAALDLDKNKRLTAQEFLNIVKEKRSTLQ